ncbi:hypothetical protein E8E12_002121 [Didymella heteroderae]|uniref:Exosome complex protein n=1 Tax=Didymella heteroderae TaxID=1769908 RepID=A0A9P5BWC7_9PLEO|nr:hypothetical protein E8E12_002121 [Didymella heteroderae]
MQAAWCTKVQLARLNRGPQQKVATNTDLDLDLDLDRHIHNPNFQQDYPMDPQTDLPDLVEDLEVNIDELTATLTPLLPPNTLSKTATSLPLLEKSKLYVLAAYAIESVLFSTLQASGADAKSHAIFPELARLKGYFGKIKDAEEHFKNLAEKEGRARLDVGAAQRFIKHGLSGNERYDELRKERMAREKERALEKARALTNKKFDDNEEEEETRSKKRGAEGADGEDGTPNKKRREHVAEEQRDDDEAHTPAPAKKRGRKGKKPAVEVEETQEEQGAEAEAEAEAKVEAGAAAGEEAMDLDAETPQPAKKKRGRPSKKDKVAPEATPHKDTPTRATRSSAPKTTNEAFQALASASPAASKSKAKGKGRGKK